MKKTMGRFELVADPDSRGDWVIVRADEPSQIAGNVYWDTQDTQNEGWAYKTAYLPGLQNVSGPMPGRRNSKPATIRRHLVAALKWEGLL